MISTRLAGTPLLLPPFSGDTEEFRCQVQTQLSSILLILSALPSSHSHCFISVANTQKHSLPCTQQPYPVGTHIGNFHFPLYPLLLSLQFHPQPCSSLPADDTPFTGDPNSGFRPRVPQGLSFLSLQIILHLKPTFRSAFSHHILNSLGVLLLCMDRILLLFPKAPSDFSLIPSLFSLLHIDLQKHRLLPGNLQPSHTVF